MWWWWWSDGILVFIRYKLGGAGKILEFRAVVWGAGHEGLKTCSSSKLEHTIFLNGNSESESYIFIIAR